MNVPAPPSAAAALFLGPAAAGAGLTWLALRYARRRGLLDEPGERRSHSVATPRGGGISITLVVLATIFALGWAHPQLRLVLQAGAVGLVLVATVGWLDDHRPLSARTRLLVHALSAALLGGALLVDGHGLLVAAIAFVAVLVLVNVWNFMDGINGLAASQAAIAAAGYALLAGAGSPSGALGLALALAGACCGFLPFNFPNARIFLGDVGSGSLGLALALLATLVMVEPRGRPDPSAWPLLVLPLAAFLVDASLTLGRRILRREQWWAPHVQHAYQVWSRTLGSHAPVTFAYAGWSLLATTLMAGMILMEGTFIIAAAATLGWCLVSAAGWLLLQCTAGSGKGRIQRT